MARRAHILIADHNSRFLSKTGEILESAGYRVRLAEGYDAARKALATGRTDVVLAGVKLGGGDGYRLCRELKARDETVPCVLMFGKEEQETVTACTNAGAENYLLRPLKKNELLSCVRDMMLVRRLKQRIESLSARPAPPRDEPTTGIRDPRTGFYTFSYFKEALYLEVKRTRRHGYPLAVLLITYDRRSIAEVRARSDGDGRHENELYGGLSLAVRRAVRETDIPVSYTPENVLVLMPHTDLDGGVTVAKRIRAVVKRSRINAGGRTFAPTLSMGVSASSQSADATFSQLVKSASRALSFAKKKGGNCIVF